MSHEGQENQGTGLRDIFDILLKAPSERLLSLTLQLGETPENSIIQALCLIVLQRETQALNKLQMLGDNSLANHLAEKWQTSGGKLQDFAVHCGHFRALTSDSLAMLARIFNVLSEKGLCDPLLRNLAYKRAISTDYQSTTSCDDLQNEQFREEAKAICGPQIAEWMSSSTEVKSESYTDPNRSLDEGNTTLKVTTSKDQSANMHCLPTPLQAGASVPSYPTHLEISIPPTISFQGDKIAPETSGNAKLNTPTLLLSESGTNIAPGQSLSSEPQSKSIGYPLSGAKKDSRMTETLAAMSSVTPRQTNKPSTEAEFAIPSATNIFPPKMTFPKEIHESKAAEEEEEEEVFYAFVILHAPEDADVAECMREKLEKVTSREGATFSEDFAIPGKSTLKCVEDAINNSAFTFLLLTRNFNTRMLEMKTNSALINSINKKHKYNTVIPLLPRDNCMPRQCVPIALQTIVPLEENKSFERKIQKSLSPARIEKQRRIWMEEQRLKAQIEERRKNLKLQTEKTNLTLLMEEHLRLGPGGTTDQRGGDGNVWWQHQPNIHIQNAKYIMIGNDSQMTVDLGGNAEKEDSVYTLEEQ